ncbi:MAG: hypothetical protein ABSG62_05075 [Terracidiphilus sp.]
MSLIKKVDVKKHLAARPLSQPDATGFSEIEPAGTGANASDFIEDFSPEHSSSSGVCHCDCDWRRIWQYSSAQRGGKRTSVKEHTLFLRQGCILPDQFDLRSRAVFKGRRRRPGCWRQMWMRVRSTGWHFVWIEDWHSFRGLGRTPRTAIHRALIGALKEVKGASMAPLSSIRMVRYSGLRMA